MLNNEYHKMCASYLISNLIFDGKIMLVCITIVSSAMSTGEDKEIAEMGMLPCNQNSNC
jgi:hypothetical protein